MNITERNYSYIVSKDLQKLFEGSKERLYQYFLQGIGKKWLEHYDIESPICIALCQGAAMHYYDKKNGVKDFDVWFFFPFNEKHLPYRTVWNWDFGESKFGKHPENVDFRGRCVDVIVRSLKDYNKNDPIGTIHRYLKEKETKSAQELSKKAIVILSPKEYFGQTVWYKNKSL